MLSIASWRNPSRRQFCRQPGPPPDPKFGRWNGREKAQEAKNRGLWPVRRRGFVSLWLPTEKSAMKISQTPFGSVPTSCPSPAPAYWWRPRGPIGGQMSRTEAVQLRNDLVRVRRGTGRSCVAVAGRDQRASPAAHAALPRILLLLMEFKPVQPRQRHIAFPGGCALAAPLLVINSLRHGGFDTSCGQRAGTLLPSGA